MHNYLSRTVVRAEGIVLAVESSDAGVVVLDQTEGDSLSLRAGDVVSTLEGYDTNTPEEFFEILRKTISSLALAVVRRDNSVISLNLDVQTFKSFLPPAPPTPPTAFAKA